MLEDKRLVWKLKRGDVRALEQIYHKYKNPLLALARSLSFNGVCAEDVVHDVFVSFAEHVDGLQIRTNLKGYLACSVVNRIRRLAYNQHNLQDSMTRMEVSERQIHQPDQQVVSVEQQVQIQQALERLPHVQREVLILHMQEGMTFKAIASIQNVSQNTAQSRYRYALEKLRNILSHGVK